ncbi:SWIM-type domain-containing protein [Frankia sp. AiPs1]|uniref:SWIM zinc finger family protein n=1 Tax=Frankia sp. AiPa1 TaxID=573492 RepID=UPI00202B60D6|nr:hypothetical protein [Frankia sp. AiPa1]MCL9762600.1 hypothetical protein [Frankia sp. AiPa1]
MPDGPSRDDRSNRESSAHSAWSRRFLTLIEDLGMTAALRDGRRLARTDAVLDLRRTGNLVVARVRHPDADAHTRPTTRARPDVDARPNAHTRPDAHARPDADARPAEIHKARLAVRTFTGGDWARIERALASRAGYAASLLAGMVPPEIDRLFAALGLSPLPTGADDLAMDCTCTDWQRPCAHLAAACHALARHLDHDPFELLALRGRERDVLLDSLRTYRTVPVPAPEAAEPPSAPAGRRMAREHSTAGIRGTATLLDQCGPLPAHSDAGNDAAGAAGTPESVSGVVTADSHGTDRMVADLRILLRPAYAAFRSQRRTED